MERASTYIQFRMRRSVLPSISRKEGVPTRQWVGLKLIKMDKISTKDRVCPSVGTSVRRSDIVVKFHGAASLVTI